MKRPIRHLVPFLAGLCLAFGALPARSATIPLAVPPLRVSCPDGAGGLCVPGGSDPGRWLVPAQLDLGFGASDTPDGTGDRLLIVRGAGTANGTDGQTVLALARLVTALSGRDGVRVWLLDTDGPGQPGLFCLRFERQTWTAGHIGDFALDLPQAAMVAARSGVLAMNEP